MTLKLSTINKQLLLLFLTALAIGNCYAQSDQINLEDGFGTQMEDAYPTAYRNREAQLLTRYTRTGDDKNKVLLNPNIEFGPFRNTEIEVGIPVILGNADKSTSGNINISALYNFNTEGLVLPAFAIAGRVELPTGIESEGVDFGGKLLFTKTITHRLDRIHLNLNYFYNTNPIQQMESGQMITERSERIVGIFGYSGRITPITILLVDYVYEQMRLKNKISHSIEVGLRQQATPRVVLSLGGSAGISADSPKFTLNIGIQRAF